MRGAGCDGECLRKSDTETGYEGCVERRGRAMELDNFLTDTHPPLLFLTRLS